MTTFAKGPNAIVRTTTVCHAVARSLPLILAIVCSGGAEALAAAPKKKAPEKSEAVAPERPPLPEQKTSGSIAAQYCESVREAAVEARFAQQATQIEALGKQLEEKAAELDSRSVKLKEWVQKREAFIRKATDQLVTIYTGMRAEAASEQMARLDPVTAASILMRLDARVASAILNEMPSDKAANLTMIVTDSAKKNDSAVKQ